MTEFREAEALAAAASHIHRQTEESLSAAYELGRDALASGLGILDVFAILEAAYAALVVPVSEAERRTHAAAVGNFFRELLSPFEMSLRGHRDANRELLAANAELKQAYGALEKKQVQLVQAAKMASLGELVAGVAHEINNPLSFVVSHLNTAVSSLSKLDAELAGNLSPPAAEHLSRSLDRIRQCQGGAARISELVLKLRTFSRLDEGEQKTVSIRDSVTSVLSILEHKSRGRIRFELRFGEPDQVECFPSLLNQALMNLIANAIDSISDQGVIEIATFRDGADYVISIADTGHGIPEHLKERVFEPFFTTKPVGEGTGLGLSITHSIVARHRGTLSLAAAPNGGTVATIRFPLDD